MISQKMQDEFSNIWYVSNNGMKYIIIFNIQEFQIIIFIYSFLSDYFYLTIALTIYYYYKKLKRKIHL